MQEKNIKTDTLAIHQKDTVLQQPGQQHAGEGDTLLTKKFQQANGDSLAMHATTPAGKDTVKAIQVQDIDRIDSVRFFQAFHHVRIFSDSMQAVCDSMFFSGRDSIFRLHINPIVWAKESQITGDTIYLYTKNKKPAGESYKTSGLFVWFPEPLSIKDLLYHPHHPLQPAQSFHRRKCGYTSHQI